MAMIPLQSNHKIKVFIADDSLIVREHLVTMLDELAGAHEQLLGAVEEKIEAMRSADTDRIRQTIEREQILVESIDEREGLRRQLTERIVRPYGVGTVAARRLSATAVMVNDHTAFRVDWMPFGGRRRSGLGVGGIPYSMKDMQTEKMMVLRSRELT